jgi:hypothetical protein
MSHPLQSYVDLCLAVGIDVARLDEMDAYMLAGGIQREVRGQSSALSQVRQMTDAQRAGLRDRALAALPPVIKRTKS